MFSLNLNLKIQMPLVHHLFLNLKNKAYKVKHILLFFFLLKPKPELFSGFCIRGFFLGEFEHNFCPWENSELYSKTKG